VHRAVIAIATPDLVATFTEIASEVIQ
jgi:hypothetical protein